MRKQFKYLRKKKVVDSMVKPTGPTNPELRKLIVELKKSKKYPELVKSLSKARRKKKAINLSDLGEKAKDERKIATTEVLGSGEITKPMWVYAWKFSKSAKEKIEKAGGKCFSLSSLLKEKDKVNVVV